MKKWECGIPGKDATIWHGGLFKVDMIFPDGELNLDIEIVGDSLSEDISVSSIMMFWSFWFHFYLFCFLCRLN